MSSRFLLLLSALTLGAAVLVTPSAQAQATDPVPASSAPGPAVPAPSAAQEGQGWHHRAHPNQGRSDRGGPHHRLTPEERQARIARFDAHFFKAHGGTANGVTREDWMKRAAQQFDRLDINHDGVISPYELNIAAKHWRHHHRHDGRHPHHGRGFRHPGGPKP